ncbi:MAG: hypothetical protein VX152_12065 [Pseudomonadota bacterium]|nr:hypothetical protein [Pseudomonadota bacterium]
MVEAPPVLPRRLASEEAPAEEAAEAWVRWAVLRLAQQLVVVLQLRRRLRAMGDGRAANTAAIAEDVVPRMRLLTPGGAG